MSRERKIALFIEAKSASRKILNDHLLNYSEQSGVPLDTDDAEFIKNDYIIQVMEFFVLLKEYGISDGAAISQFAFKRNEEIEKQILELRDSNGSPGIIAAHIADLKRGVFSKQAIQRLDWIMNTHAGLEQAALSRFLAGYMSDTWLKRCLKIMVQLRLLNVEDNQFGGKVYTPMKTLFEIYEDSVSCFSNIWES